MVVKLLRTLLNRTFPCYSICLLKNMVNNMNTDIPATETMTIDSTQVNGDRPSSRKGLTTGRFHWPSWLKTAGVVGAISLVGSLIGIVISVQDFQQKQPKLAVMNPNVQLIPSDLSELSNALYRVYSNAPSTIDTQLWDLMQELQSARDSDDDMTITPTEARKKIITEMKAAFESKIKYYNGKFTNEKNQEAAKNIAEKLQKLQKEYLEEDSSRVYALFSINNQSKTPNIIQGSALLVAYDDNGRLFELPLTISSLTDKEKQSEEMTNATQTQEGGDKTRHINREISEFPYPFPVDGEHTISLMASSKALNSFDQVTKEAVTTSWGQSHDYLLLVQDVNGRIWKQEGALSRIGVDENLDRLKLEANSIIQKRLHEIGQS